MHSKCLSHPELPQLVSTLASLGHVVPLGREGPSCPRMIDSEPEPVCLQMQSLQIAAPSLILETPRAGGGEENARWCSEGWVPGKAARAKEWPFVGGQLEDRCLLKITLAREARARSRGR